MDGELDAISPNYIYSLNPVSGKSTTGGSGIGIYALDVEVVMVGLSAPEQWRTEKGIELMGPRHFDCTPIEDRQAKRKVD